MTTGLQNWLRVTSLASLALFALVATGVQSGATLSFDLGVRAAVHAATTDGLTLLAVGASLLGSNAALIGQFVAAVAGLALAGRRRAIVILAVAMAGAVILENGLKLLFGRVRPEPFFGIAPETYSFPSGHVVFSACFYGTLCALLFSAIHCGKRRATMWSGTVTLVAVIAWSRIYLGVHYPTDTIGGLLIALPWLTALGSFSIRRRQGPAEEDPAGGRHHQY